VSDGDVVYILGVNSNKNAFTWDIEVEEAVTAGPTTGTAQVSADFGMQYTTGGKIHFAGTLTITVEGKGASVAASQKSGGPITITAKKNVPLRVTFTWQATLSQTTERKDYPDGAYRQVTYTTPFITEPFTNNNFDEIGTMTVTGNSAVFEFTAPLAECSSEVEWPPHMMFSEYDENGVLLHNEGDQTLRISSEPLIYIFLEVE
jgi:hypothetical protein